MADSSRHHYVPKFYLDGFKNKDGFLYVYDKEKDLIRKSSPKSIFYEWDRNTIENKRTGEKSSTLEDLYSKIDTDCSIAIRNLRELPNVDNSLIRNNTGGLFYFIINQFWRSPKLDNTFDDFYKRTNVRLVDKNNVEITDPSLLEKVKESEVSKKMARANVIGETMNKILAMKTDETTHQRLIGLPYNVFLTGDFPIIYQSDPCTLEDILHKELFLPISSNRIYHTASKCTEISNEKVIDINTVIIAQAHRYVCGSNEKALIGMVEYYKELIKLYSVHSLRHKLFQ